MSETEKRIDMILGIRRKHEPWEALGFTLEEARLECFDTQPLNEMTLGD